MKIQRIGILVFLLMTFQSLLMAQTADYIPLGCNSLQSDVTLAGAEDGYIIVLSGSTIDFNPSDGTSYTINSMYGAGTDVSPLADGEYIVYDGIGNSIITGIPNSTDVFYEVFPYFLVNGNKIYSLATSFSGITDPLVPLDVDFIINNPTCSADNVGSVSLDIISGVGPYSWTLDTLSGVLSDTLSMASLNALSPGPHTFTISDVYGCEVVYPFSITGADSLSAGIVNLIPTTCPGDMDGYAEFYVTTNGLSGSVATVGFISPDGIQPSTNGNWELSGLSAGTYDVVYFSQPDSSCSDTLSFTILDGAFTADAAIAAESCSGAADGTIGLTNLSGGTGPYTISWTDADGNAVGTGTDLTAGEGIYTASILDDNACMFTQVYSIGLDGTNCTGCASTVTAADLYDIFTPNGDNMNDIWQINGLGSCATNKLTICNRWGDKVFEDSNLTSSAWDGTGVNGEALPTGAYYYFLELDDDTDPNNLIKGVINLVR